MLYLRNKKHFTICLHDIYINIYIYIYISIDNSITTTIDYDHSGHIIV